MGKRFGPVVLAQKSNTGGSSEDPGDGASSADWPDELTQPGPSQQDKPKGADADQFRIEGHIGQNVNAQKTGGEQEAKGSHAGSYDEGHPKDNDESKGLGGFGSGRQGSPGGGPEVGSMGGGMNPGMLPGGAMSGGPVGPGPMGSGAGNPAGPGAMGGGSGMGAVGRP